MAKSLASRVALGFTQSIISKIYIVSNNMNVAPPPVGPVPIARLQLYSGLQLQSVGYSNIQ